MPTVQVNANLTPEKILEAVRQFNSVELDEFTDQVVLLRTQRHVPHLTKREMELLQRINQGIPKEVLQPYRLLKGKLEAEELTEAEHGELLHLVDEVEQYDVERLEYLIKLSQIRNQSVTELMDDLGLLAQDAAE